MAPLRAIVLALASTAARGGDVTLAPLEGKSGAERAVLIVPGANRGFSAAQYAALGAAVQGASAAKLWVGIPEFEDGTSVDDASVFEAGAQRVLAVLAAAGMDAAAPLVAAGHSDGGAMVEAYAHAADGALALEAVALLGSYIPRAHYAATPSNAAISTSSTAECVALSPPPAPRANAAPSTAQAATRCFPPARPRANVAPSTAQAAKTDPRTGSEQSAAQFVKVTPTAGRAVTQKRCLARHVRNNRDKFRQ
jgi:hypothetical protein